MSPTLAKPQAPHAKPQTQPQIQDSTQTFPPPRLAPPPKSIGPRVGTKPQAQPIRLPAGEGQQPIKFTVGGVGLEGQQLSPEVIVDPLNLSPSASPGMIKSLKELDNQDQQLLNQQPQSPQPRDPNDNQPPSLQTNNTPLTGVPKGGGGKTTEPPLFKSHSTHARLQGTPPSPAARDSNLTADNTDRSCPSHPLEKSHSEGDKDTATRDSNLLNTLTLDDPKIAYIDETNSIDDSQ